MFRDAQLQYQWKPAGPPRFPDVVGIAGMAWFQPISEPHFPRKVKAHFQKTEAWVYSEAALIVGIEGISWMKGWEPPFFPTRMKVQLQQVGAYVAPETVTVGVAGMAWYQALDYQFKPRVPPTQQQFLYQVLLPPDLVSLIQGMAWYKELSTWTKKPFPASLQQTELKTSIPYNLVDTIQGIAWWRPLDVWNKPKFPVGLQQTEGWNPRFQPAIGPSGIPWRIALDEPFFPRKMKVYLQKTEMFLNPPSTLPVPIGGMAWRVPLEEWRKKRYPVYLQPFAFHTLSTEIFVLPTEWWYRQLDWQWKPKVKVYLQQTQMQTIRPYPVTFARGYIIGPG